MVQIVEELPPLGESNEHERNIRRTLLCGTPEQQTRLLAAEKDPNTDPRVRRTIIKMCGKFRHNVKYYYLN